MLRVILNHFRSLEKLIFEQWYPKCFQITTLKPHYPQMRVLSLLGTSCTIKSGLHGSKIGKPKNVP